MASGKQSKRLRQQSRAAGPPPVRSKNAGRRASPKVLAAASGALVLAAVAIVLVVTLTGNNGKSDAPISVAADLSSVNGIQQHGLVLGNPLAKVTLTEYMDTSCPICREYVLNTFPILSTTYIRSGRVKVDARVVAFVGPTSSQQGRQLVLAAARQNKAWQMLELLYQNQGDETQAWVTDDLSRALGAKIPGLDVDRLMTDTASSAVRTEAARLDGEMSADGVRATPTFVLTTPDGKRQLLGAGNPSAATFTATLDKALSSP